MSAVAGLLSVHNADTTNDLVGEFQETILVRNAKGMNAGTTLFGLMSRLRSEPSENSEFHWFERDPTQREVYAHAANAGAVTSTTTGQTIQFDVDAVGTAGAWPILAQGQVLRNVNSGELIRVESDPTTDTATVTRAFGATGSFSYTIAAHDKWAIITLGKDEGALPSRAAYENPSVLINYIQTFNSTVFLSNAFKGNKLRTDIEGPLRDRRIQALEKIGKDIELAYLFGVQSSLVGTNGNVYYTGGVKSAVDSAAPNNALNGNGSSGVAIASVNSWLQSFMVYGSDAKLALCGPMAYAAISTYANSATNGFRIMNQEQVWGMNITVINTPFGELDLAFHPLLKEVTSFQDWMLVVDLAHLVQKTMEPLFLEPNIQTPGQDAYQEQYRAKLGLKLKFAEAFAYAYGFQKIN